MAGPIPFPFAFRTRRTKSFRFYLAVSRFPGWLRGSPGVSRSQRIATLRESIRGVRRFLCFFFFLVYWGKNLSLELSSRLRMTEDICRIIYRDNAVTITGIRWTHIRILPIDTCVCVRVYVCMNVLMLACACVSRSPSVLYLVYHKSGGKKERKLYIGTSKKVYFTIPLAVEDRYYL